MSDRIDELVAAIDANTLLQWDGKDVALEAAHELATIAREAEADRWRKVAYNTAAGMLSTYQPYRGWHLEGVLEYIESGIAAIEQEEAE